MPILMWIYKDELCRKCIVLNGPPHSGKSTLIKCLQANSNFALYSLG